MIEYAKKYIESLYKFSIEHGAWVDSCGCCDSIYITGSDSSVVARGLKILPNKIRVEISDKEYFWKVVDGKMIPVDEDWWYENL